MENNQYPLRDDFFSFCDAVCQNKNKKIFKNVNLETAVNYVDVYLPGLRDKLEKYDFEKDFLDVIPYLLFLSKFEECTQVLLRVYRAVQLEMGGNEFESYRTAFNLYANFIQSVFIKKPHKQVLSAITLPNNLSLNTILSALNNVKVYFYVTNTDILSVNGLKLNIKNYNLWRILKNRLGSQNRTSGNKTWISMDLIRKIKDPNSKNESIIYNKYIHEINKNSFIHAVDNNCHQVLIKCGDVWCLYLYKSSGQSNYYVKVTTKYNYKTYDVLTPTAAFGEKTLMKVADISKVAIDHVKPIDQSLREFEANGQIPELVKLSNAYKDAKRKLGSNAKESKIVDLAYSLIKSTVDAKKLDQEMVLLLNDSWYRLMDSKQNSTKGNDNMFYEFRTMDGSNPSLATTIGLMMKANHTTYRQVMIVYQKLNNPGIGCVNSASYVNSTYPYKIDLTSFKSVWGPEIL